MAGGFGSLVSVWASVAPCFPWILLGGPYVAAQRGNRWRGACLSAITAAVVGVIVHFTSKD